MELSQFDLKKSADQPAVCNIVHPVTEEQMFKEDGVTPVTVTILGQDSSKARKLAKAQAQRTLNSRKKQTVDELQAFGRKLVASLVTDVDGITENGEPVKADAEQLEKLFESYPWIYDQLDAFIADKANFYQA